MDRKDLKNYKYMQVWIKDRIEYIETQKSTINRLNSILSDMPKGSRQVYDNEAEKIAKLMDCFNSLMDIVLKEEEEQRKIVEQVQRVEFPYSLILDKVYIQGKTLVKVADEMDYDYKHLCYMNGIALNKFDKLDK